MDTNKSVNFPIDGGSRTLKTRSGTHLFCQKENLPAGVAYKNLAILSCSAVLLEQLTCLKASLLKLRNRPGIAKLLPWSSGKHPNSVVYTKISLVPRESCSFIYAKKMKRNVCCQVCFAMKLSCWQHRAAFICECPDQCVAHCSLFKVCSSWALQICGWVYKWANSYKRRGAYYGCYDDAGDDDNDDDVNDADDDNDDDDSDADDHDDDDDDDHHHHYNSLCYCRRVFIMCSSSHSQRFQKSLLRNIYLKPYRG